MERLMITHQRYSLIYNFHHLRIQPIGRPLWFNFLPKRTGFLGGGRHFLHENLAEN